LSPIPLLSTRIESGGKGTEWRESNGEWRLQGDMQSDAIEGVWTNPDKSRTLPIKLTRVKEPIKNESTDEDDQDFDAGGSDAYNTALEFPRKPLFGPVQTVNGVKYRKIAVNLVKPEKLCFDKSSLCMETVELLGNTPSITAINEQLRKLYPPVSEFSSELLACRRSALQKFGDDGLLIQKTHVSVIGRWFTLKLKNVGDCVGMRGSYSEREYIWNLDTGEPENLFSWFQGGESTKSNWFGGGILPEPLAEFVYFRIEAGGPYHLGLKVFLECYGQDYNEYVLRLFDGGIEFVIPFHDNGACGDRYKISFNELRPFLSEKGKAAAALFRKPGAKKKQ
jgi:hypothetical protein